MRVRGKQRLPFFSIKQVPQAYHSDAKLDKTKTCRDLTPSLRWISWSGVRRSRHACLPASWRDAGAADTSSTCPDTGYISSKQNFLEQQYLRRLLNTATLAFSEFFDEQVPDYAILSRRWSSSCDETTFKDFSKGRITESVGFRKVLAFCEFTRLRGHKWGWIDTCGCWPAVIYTLYSYGSLMH